MERLVHPDGVDIRIVHEGPHKGERGQTGKAPGVCQGHKFGQHIAVRQSNVCRVIEGRCVGMERLCSVVQTQEPRGIQEHQGASCVSAYSLAKSASICSLSAPVASATSTAPKCRSKHSRAACCSAAVRRASVLGGAGKRPYCCSKVCASQWAGDVPAPSAWRWMIV